MTEITVSDLTKSMTWYCDTFGLTIEHHDDLNQFALLQGQNGTRLALKYGEPQPSGIGLYFRVEDLAKTLIRLKLQDHTPKISPEGYRSVTLYDADHYRIVLFEFIKGPDGHQPN
jgi:predicted enzyme related to lactoylglutathione lyase